jgi:hypothetical protein
LKQEQDYWSNVRINYDNNLHELYENTLKIQCLYYPDAESYKDEIDDIIDGILPQKTLYFTGGSKESKYKSETEVRSKESRADSSPIDSSIQKEQDTINW